MKYDAYLLLDEGVRIEVDHLQQLVHLYIGHHVVDQLTWHELEQLVGLRAASEMVRR